VSWSSQKEILQGLIRGLELLLASNVGETTHLSVTDAAQRHVQMFKTSVL
jgi:hypothetical protein